MVVSSFTSSNDSLLHPQPSSSSPFLLYMNCYISKPASFIFITTSVASIIIPLTTIVFLLFHDVKQRRPNTSTSPATVSHSDCFTYHMIIVELTGVFGYILLLSTHVSYENYLRMEVGTLVLFLNWYGQTCFHVLTCVERYLAVVHPIAYLNLRNKRGVRVRNAIIGGVWLLSFVWTSLLMTKTFIITDLCFYILSLMIVFYCSLSVLWVLIHPGPGEQSGGRERVDQSKQRAFYTIVVILGVLLLTFVGSLVWKLAFTSEISNGCLVMASVSWSNVPSSLVLPLLFLHRAGKLVCCKK